MYHLSQHVCLVQSQLPCFTVNEFKPHHKDIEIMDWNPDGQCKIEEAVAFCYMKVYKSSIQFDWLVYKHFRPS